MTRLLCALVELPLFIEFMGCRVAERRDCSAIVKILTLGAPPLHFPSRCVINCALCLCAAHLNDYGRFPSQSYGFIMAPCVCVDVSKSNGAFSRGKELWSQVGSVLEIGKCAGVVVFEFIQRRDSLISQNKSLCAHARNWMKSLIIKLVLRQPAGVFHCEFAPHTLCSKVDHLWWTSLAAALAHTVLTQRESPI